MTVSDLLLHPTWLKLPWGGGARDASSHPRSRPSPKTRTHRTDQRRWQTSPQPELQLTDPLAPPTVVVPALSPRLAQAPPWLISLVIHLAAMIALSLWILPASRGPLTRVLTLTPTEVVDVPALESLPAMTMEVVELAAPLSRVSAPLAAEIVPIEVELANDALALDKGPTSSPSAGIDDLFGAGGGGTKGATDGLLSAEFFGVQAVGRSFVFVVDCSNSMRQGKLEAAKEELLYSIRHMSPEQSFYVIFFSGTTAPMSLDDSGQPASEPVAATNENVEKLAAWVETVGVDPWTDPSEAMRMALAMQPDAIYLLSDGRFTDRGETLRLLKRENHVREDGKRRPKVVIHTVGFYQRDGEATLKSIARSNGGTYRFVAPAR